MNKEAVRKAPSKEDALQAVQFLMDAAGVDVSESAEVLRSFINAAIAHSCAEPMVYGSTDLTDGITIAGLALTDGDKRLVALVLSALGPKHPAMDDLVALLFQARSARQSEGA